MNRILATSTLLLLALSSGCMAIEEPESDGLEASGGGKSDNANDFDTVYFDPPYETKYLCDDQYSYQECGNPGAGDSPGRIKIPSTIALSAEVSDVSPTQDSMTIAPGEARVISAPGERLYIQFPAPVDDWISSFRLFYRPAGEELWNSMQFDDDVAIAWSEARIDPVAGTVKGGFAGEFVTLDVPGLAAAAASGAAHIEYSIQAYRTYDFGDFDPGVYEQTIFVSH